MTVELTPLGTLIIEVDEQVRVDGVPAGSRVVGTARAARFEGARVRASEMLSPANDWLTLYPDGTGSVDARILLRTDDGAHILIRYGGRITYGGEKGASMVVAPTFETDHEQYRWLNGIQAIAKGERKGSHLVYEVYTVA